MRGREKNGGLRPSRISSADQFGETFSKIGFPFILSVIGTGNSVKKKTYVTEFYDLSCKLID